MGGSNNEGPKKETIMDNDSDHDGNNNGDVITMFM